MEKKKKAIQPYEDHDPSPIKVTINETINNELSLIREKLGVLTPENVLEVAKDKKNPLHRFFEWDDKKAAHKHRLWQARTIIERVKVIINSGGEPIQGWVSVKSGTSGQARVYHPIREVLQDPDATERMIETAVRTLETWTAKYQEIQKAHRKEYSLIAKGVEGLKKKIDKKKSDKADDNP